MVSGVFQSPPVAIIRSRLDAGLSPRPELSEFARTILNADIVNYQNLSRFHEVTFFDRSIVDALGMLSQLKAISEEMIQSYLHDYPYHTTVFLFPPWEEIYRTDDERDQTFAESVRVFEIIKSWYTQCGYLPIEVPLDSVEKRAEFVEHHITVSIDKNRFWQ